MKISEASKYICLSCQLAFRNNDMCKYTIIEDGKRKEMINFCPKRAANDRLMESKTSDC